MRYLFFDIECCNGRNICEFGYVITDDKFNILEKKDITINPENKFNLTGRHDGRDLYLYYPESTYYKSYKFPHFYDDIKEIIEHPDQLIVGHIICNKCNNYLDMIDMLNTPFEPTNHNHLIALLTAKTIAKKDGKIRYNISFAAKFCTYAAIFLNSKIQYSK